MGLRLTDKQWEAYQNGRNAADSAPACRAPFSSMFLGLRGNVSVCCFNKTYLLGKFPESSLKEMWFGQRADRIRASLKEGDFSLGCHGCHDLIRAGNFANLPARNFDRFLPTPHSFPSKIDFELSNECNLECIMCRGEFSSAIRKNREKLPPIPSPYGQDLLDQLGDFLPYLKEAHFLGGEPFMVPLYLDIWERMARINPSIRISVQTNATLLSARIRKILEELNIDIAVSIDSLEKTTYESIRKNARFEIVMENLAYFRDYCRQKGTRLTLSYCPMPQNWQEIPDLIHQCNHWGIQVFFNTVTFPKSCSFTSLSPDQLKTIEQEYLKTRLPKNTVLERANAAAFQGIIRQLAFWASDMKEKAVRQVADLSTYFLGLKEYMQQNHSDEPEDWTTRFEDIRKKLEFVVAKAEEKGLGREAEEKLVQVDFKTICQSISGEMDKEHILHLFRAFLMPMPE